MPQGMREVQLSVADPSLGLGVAAVVAAEFDKELLMEGLSEALSMDTTGLRPGPAPEPSGDSIGEIEQLGNGSHAEGVVGQ